MVFHLTAGKVIAYVNKLKPSSLDEGIFLGWLSEIDGQIFEEIIKPREGAISVEPDRYDFEDYGRELIVPDPYAMDLYCSYLKTRIDLEHGEIEKYNQNAELFEVAMQRFRDWYCSTHPLKRVQWHFSF